MRAQVWRLVTTLTLATATATATVDAAPTLEPFGLQGRVLSLGFNGSLYAGTFGDGVFRRDVSNPQATWVPLGLEAKRVRAVYPRACGPLGTSTLVGLQGNPILTDSALVYRAEMDQLPWAEDDAGMSRANVTAVWSLAGFATGTKCGATFASSIGPTGGVWKRTADNAPWQVVLDIGFGAGNVVHVDPASGNVWAGGENAVLSPWIARSTDGGDTWHTAHPDLAGDNACDAIDVHPNDPDVAYAGMEGAVLRTVDGGKTWQQTGLGLTQAYMYGLALDSATPTHILAGGTVTNPNSWALWETFDAGATWSEIPAPLVKASDASSGVTAAGITSLIADPTRGGTFYIATDGHGVWRYLSTPSSTPFPLPPPQLVLAPAYPNPFNARTTLPFEVPPSLDGARVRLAIYNVRGDLVRVVLNANLPAGPHRTTWDGADANQRIVGSGVYYCSVQAGSQHQSRAIVLVK
jgi:hypothetical protein